MSITPLILSACGGSTTSSSSFGNFDIDLASTIDVAENIELILDTPKIIGTPLGEITYSISGLDSDQFSVNINNGAVSLKPQDFETMIDSDHNNLYTLSLTATDEGGANATKLIQVNVQDVNEIASFQLDGQSESLLMENSSLTGAFV